MFGISFDGNTERNKRKEKETKMQSQRLIRNQVLRFPWESPMVYFMTKDLLRKYFNVEKKEYVEFWKSVRVTECGD